MADFNLKDDLLGFGRSQLKYLLFHNTTLAGLTDFDYKKGLFFYDTDNDSLEVLHDDTDKWRTTLNIVSLNDPLYSSNDGLENRVLVGTSAYGTVSGYNPSTAGFLKTDIDGILSTQALITFEDIEPTDYTTVITAPGVHTRFATEKAIVDYVSAATFSAQDNILDWDGTKYLPFAAKKAVNPGYAYFYTGVSLPSFAANNLNLDGNLRANNIFAMLSGTTRYSILAYNGFGNYSAPTGKNAEVTIFANSTGTGITFRSRDIVSGIGIPIRIGHDTDVTGVGYHNEAIIIDDYNQLFNIDMTTVRLNKGTALKYLYLDASKNITYVDAPAGGVTPVDNILDWNTDSYRPYTAKTASAFYTGVTVPDAVATILNYDGIVRATQMFEGNTRVMTTHGSWVANGTLHAVTTTSHAGFCPQLPLVGTTTTFLRADGTWTDPMTYWNRTGIKLSPKTPNDWVEIISNTNDPDFSPLFVEATGNVFVPLGLGKPISSGDTSTYTMLNLVIYGTGGGTTGDTTGLGESIDFLKPTGAGIGVRTGVVAGRFINRSTTVGAGNLGAAFEWWLSNNGTVGKKLELTQFGSLETLRGQYHYHSQTMGEDTIGDWRTFGNGTAFYTEYCTVGNAVKGGGTWVVKQTITI